MINLEIRTTEERKTVQRLIDRALGGSGPDDARLRMQLAAAKAWDTKMRMAKDEDARPRCSTGPMSGMLMTLTQTDDQLFVAQSSDA